MTARSGLPRPCFRSERRRSPNTGGCTKIRPQPDRSLKRGYRLGVLALKKSRASDDPVEHPERRAFRAERDRLLDFGDAFVGASEIDQLGSPLRVSAGK